MPKIHFIHPEKSIPASIAKWLAQNLCDNHIASFFGDSLILVPTKSAIKSLRIELLDALKQKGINAMSGLKITTLESFFSEIASVENCASSVQRIAAWIEALEGNSQKFAMFPNGTPTRENLLELAIELDHLRNILSEKPADFSQTKDFLAQNANQSPYENSLWHELSQLEIKYENSLAKMGVKCKYRILQDAINSPKIKYKKIVIAGNPDVPANLKLLLKNIENTVETFVLVVAQPRQYAGFDEIGRPSASFFETEEIDVSQKNTFVFNSVQAQAEAVAKLAKEYAQNATGTIAVSCEQLKNAYYFKNAFKHFGLKAHVPEADNLSSSLTYKVLKARFELSEIETFTKLNALLCNPLISSIVCNKFEMTETEVFALFDFVRENFLPTNMQSAIETLQKHNHDKSVEVLLFINELLQAINSSPKTAVETLSTMLSYAKDSIGNENFEFENEALFALKICADEIEHVQKSFNFTTTEIHSLLLKALESKSSRFPDTENSIPLNNWVEIFWSRKPHLLLCDMNDGIVPLKTSENQFLPDSAMERLGIRNSTLRRARDAYMLKALQLTRGNAVEILLSLKDTIEAPIMPSRILLQTTELAQRVKFLFKEPTNKQTELSAPTEIKLKIGKHLPENFSMSASKFKSYLTSPLDFYFNYVLKAQEVSPEKTEFDVLQYGTIFHYILSKFAVSKIKNSQDSAEIYAFLKAELDDYIKTEFSTTLSAQIQFQMLSMKQRFFALAEVQAEHTSQGWEIFGKPETRFAFDLDGMKITGSIDRIDYNKNTNQYLIIDYKTYNKVEPNITRDKHILKIDNQNNIYWQDLQMPLYKLAMKKIFDLDCVCALFVSPLDTSETIIDVWNITQEEYSSAQDKISEIIKDIREEKFIPETPPNHEILPNTLKISRKNILPLIEK